MAPESGTFRWPGLADYVLEMESRGMVTRTFRRLDPERQVEIIHAILEEGLERGLGSVNIKNVARRAQASVGSLYQYFGDRGTMIEFTISLCLTYMERVLAESEPYLIELPLEDALAYYILGGCDWAEQQSLALRFFSRAAYGGDEVLSEKLVRPIATAMRGIVGKILARAVERGELRQNMDLELATGLVHSFTLVLGDTALLPYLDDYFQIQRGELEARVRAGLELILRGLR